MLVVMIVAARHGWSVSGITSRGELRHGFRKPGTVSSVELMMLTRERTYPRATGGSASRPHQFQTMEIYHVCSEDVIARISQETLAEMVGTTRSRVSFFMNRFRKLGYVNYSGKTREVLRVHSSLLSVVLHD